MNYKLLFLTILIILISTSTASASNQTDDVNTFCNVQNSVDLASENDTITLNGIYKSNGEAIKINKSLTFNGENNATFDANHLSGVFNITRNSTLTFNNLNFINSNKTVISMLKPNMLEDYKSKVILNNCSFINNYGDDDGAIYVYECIVNNSKFINNHAIGLDDEERSWGGAISTQYCTITDSIFINNTALSNGGAVLSEHGLIKNCIFINNTAGWEGGAFEITDVSVLDTNFTQNIASWQGGAIFTSEGDIFNCNFNNNTANHSGGSIYANRITLFNSNFTSNTALYAGAIYTFNLKINNCSFRDNHEGAIISQKTTIDFKTTFSKQISFDNSLKPTNLIKVDAQSIKIPYLSHGKLIISFTTTENNKKASFLEFLLIIKNGKKTQYVYESSDGNGICNYSIPKLNSGKYEFIISSYYEDAESYTCPFQTKTVTVTIQKAKTIVKAPKVTNKYKRSKYFKVSVKYKTNKKAIKNLKIKLKIYTAKKTKSYTIKTYKTGIAKFKTNKLTKGKHKVIITSANNNFAVSKKSSIKIK